MGSGRPAKACAARCTSGPLEPLILPPWTRAHPDLGLGVGGPSVPVGIHTPPLPPRRSPRRHTEAFVSRSFETIYIFTSRQMMGFTRVWKQISVMQFAYLVRSWGPGAWSFLPRPVQKLCCTSRDSHARSSYKVRPPGLRVSRCGGPSRVRTAASPAPLRWALQECR